MACAVKATVDMLIFIHDSANQAVFCDSDNDSNFNEFTDQTTPITKIININKIPH